MFKISRPPSILLCSLFSVHIPLVAIDWVKVKAEQYVVSLIHHVQFLQYINYYYVLLEAIKAFFFVTNNFDDDECADYIQFIFGLFAVCAHTKLSGIRKAEEGEYIEL